MTELDKKEVKPIRGKYILNAPAILQCIKIKLRTHAVMIIMNDIIPSTQIHKTKQTNADFGFGLILGIL